VLLPIAKNSWFIDKLRILTAPSATANTGDSNLAGNLASQHSSLESAISASISSQQRNSIPDSAAADGSRAASPCSRRGKELPTSQASNISAGSIIEESWRPREHGREVMDFASSRQECCLFAFFDTGGNLRMQKHPPHQLQSCTRIAYFTRAGCSPLEPSDLEEEVNFGVVQHNVTDCLLNILRNVYVPQLLSSQSWPESVKKDFNGQLHKFMAKLTENAYEARGQTVLYIPYESIDDPASAARDKDFVKELESTVIHWTRQIKEIVNLQDMNESGEDAGPLEEIEFWRSQYADLGGIQAQLDHPNVKAICEVLKQSESSYLDHFRKLSTDVQGEASAAESTLRFLRILEPSCKELSHAQPKEIPAILPRILHRVRVIWNESEYYQIYEHLVRLLRKVSNAIINRCMKKISLYDVVDGDLDACKTLLCESIDAGEAWKTAYARVVAAVSKHGSRSWNFDSSTIFAHIDAFIQRCRDMLDICEAEAQFSPKNCLPPFGGNRGAEIIKSLQDIQNSFQKLIDKLRALDYQILDVKATQWYVDYNSFKSSVQELEVLMNNVIMHAFESAPTLSTRVELLEAFESIARHKSVKQSVERKAQETYTMFIDEIKAVSEHFHKNKNSPPKDYNMPKYAGAAMWAESLRKRLEQPISMLSSSDCLPNTVTLSEVFKEHSRLYWSLEQYKQQECHQRWIQLIDLHLFHRLESNLICSNNNESGLLERNFDSHLLTVFEEVRVFQDLEYEIPYNAADLNTKRDHYRVLREQVLLVVREYNRITHSLTSEERRLFANRIQSLDSRINLGTTRLTWTNSKSQLDSWIKDARKHCQEVFSMVTDYKSAMKTISDRCEEIATTSLLKVDPKKGSVGVFEFEETQKARFKKVRDLFEHRHTQIDEMLEHVHQIFQNDSEDVQQELARLTHQVDDKMYDALRSAVKKSLSELNKLINNDKRRRVGEQQADGSEMLPIFNVSVVLKENESLDLLPTIAQIRGVVENVCHELVAVTKTIPRLKQDRVEDDISGGKKLVRPIDSFHEKISRGRVDDNSFSPQKYISTITSGISGIEDDVRTGIRNFQDDFRTILEKDKEAYMRRMENNPLQKFDTDISSSVQFASNALSRDRYPNQTDKFLHIDYSPAKQAVYEHCQEWIKKLSSLLNNKAKSKLESLYKYMDIHTDRLLKRPQTIDELTESLNLLSKLQSEKEETQSGFKPVYDMYSILEKHGVEVAEEETQRLEHFQSRWAEYESVLDSASEELEKSKDYFREKLKNMIDALVSEVNEYRQSFREMAPFHYRGVTNPETIQQAFEVIEDAESKCQDFRRVEHELYGGMQIFKMPQPPLKELQSTEHDLQMLRTLWDLINEWNETYSSYKGSKFQNLQVEDMESNISSYGRRIQKLGKDFKECGAWTAVKEVVDAFKKTMPLLTDLRNPALRQRHWNHLMESVGETFDPHSDSFTLAKVLSLRLDQYSELISNISNNATKELNLEQSLEQIKKTWDELELDIVPCRERKEAYKLKSTDDIFATLEDHIVQLAQMKATRFYVIFEQNIILWEQRLSKVSEILELVLKVQTSYMYLENIFSASDDIRRQLPDESALFDDVDAKFRSYMSQMAEEKNVLRACSLSGMLNLFNNIDEKLEKIQRSLEGYLETKRQRFSRFYFISSDDLLKILGELQEPENVQPYFKSMFEGMSQLDINKPSVPGGAGANIRRLNQVDGMNGPDGEYLHFLESKSIDGRPEDWLNDVEREMNQSVRCYLYKALENSKSLKKEKWVKDNPGQCIITAGQVIWTNECEKALSEPEVARSALKHLKKKWVSYLNKLTGLTRSKLSKIDRSKVVALITVEVHARDVIDRLICAGCTSAADFDWTSQLRFYWDNYLGKDGMGECIVKQVVNVFNYGYEYQGNNGRLVITPLTDRCYMTLGTALYTKRGGNPLGPAGTGKTETVKDFGKALGRYVVVFNCSDGVDNQMTGKMFSGLAQTGAWACLDEFNRIPIEVLSVVATQISTMMNAIKAGESHFTFEGQEIRLIPSCGIFVTMNPGYAGRSELPDNLKAILRPISMMVPDFSLIAEILLFSEGFQTARALSKKLVSIMELSQQQLSKQDHYDYSLRSFITPIVHASGALKRGGPAASEELLLYRTIRDLIMPKLVFVDMPLFQTLLGDLFPGIELPEEGTSTLRGAIEAELKENNAQVVPEFVDKIIQIYNCKVARHGNMIVGQANSGKTEAWRTLQRAISRLKSQDAEGAWEEVQVHLLNPLSLSNDEMFGNFDEATREWSDGVLSKIMRSVSKDTSPTFKWVIFDGPVDTLWVESMNSLLDDNKLLTLLSGERIMIPQQVSLLFEVDDLSQASPATISRAGMIHLNVEDLGWWPYVKSWLANKQDTKLVEALYRKFESILEEALMFRRRECSQIVPNDDLTAVKQLCSLFDALATENNGVTTEDSDVDTYVHMIDLNFLFALIWSVGATLTDGSRKRFDMFLREKDSRFPANDTVFEFFVDGKKKQWQPWDRKLPSAYKPPADVPYHRVMVPTTDTIRTQSAVNALMGIGNNVLIVGNVGVGKTMICHTILSKLPEDHLKVQINFSAQTSAQMLQSTIEGRMEKRTKGIFAPIGGKKLVTYIDDLNMPKKSTFGFMPPLELLKFWIDYGFWYDRAKRHVKHINNMQLLTSMAPPGGGRNSLDGRIAACYSIVNVANPSDSQLKRIFSSLLNSRLQDFDDEVKSLSDGLSAASIDIFNSVSVELLPIPSKSHYVFNIRDISRVILGLMRATRQYYDNKDAMLQLWVHENLRVYSDRMWDKADKDWMQWLLDDRLLSHFSSSWNSLFDSKTGCPPFVNFMRDVERPPYEAVTEESLKRFLYEKLEDHASEPNVTRKDLVLFLDALHHVCRIHRVLTQPEGNALLVGAGGTGRKSLAQLAAYIAEMKVFSITMTGKYRIDEFREDLKSLFRQTGVEQEDTVFLIDETQIVEERFLEDINKILTCGEVPNLFSKDELQSICEEVRPAAKKEGICDTTDDLYSYLIQCVTSNLHLVICLSPIGKEFTERLQMYPGLVSCCTIDWFSDWPADALYEVAQKQLENEDLGSEEMKKNVCSAFVTTHQSTRSISEKMLVQHKRHNYVTPTNYLDFVNEYKSLMREKRNDLETKASKLRGGLSKLNETGKQVKEMQGVIQEKRETVEDAKKNSEATLVTLVQKKRDADEQEKQVKSESERIEREAKEAKRIKQDADDGLAQAQPELEKARGKLEVVSERDLSEMRVYTHPPAAIEYCMKSVMTVLKKRKTWEEAKSHLSRPRAFKETLKNFDSSKLDDNLLSRMKEYVDDTTYFSPEYIRKNGSSAAEGLCQWVHAMYAYGIVLKDVVPKQREAEKAQANLEKKQAELKEKEEQLEQVNQTVWKLKEEYDESTSNKQRLENELQDLETKIDRAENLVNGLAGERSRWEASVSQFEEQMQNLPGDVVVAAAFLSYAGPFPSEYRDELVQSTWLPQVKSLEIPSSADFDFTTFLADPSDVRDWNIQGLPADSFSTENGVIVTRGWRWTLMIDPQGQATKWVRNMEKGNGLKVLTPNMNDMIRRMEECVQLGTPVLLEDLGETIDRTLKPLLEKAFVKRGSQLLVKIGDKEIEFNPEFRLYLATKLSNPHYSPELSTKVAIVNFQVRMIGLESQLLNFVVQKERPDLDKEKSENVTHIAQGKRTLQELEDQLLDLLANSTGSLLDNLELINTLNQSKQTSKEVTEKLRVAEQTKGEIEHASAEYKSISTRAATLYFVLNDMAAIDPMYQFSLDSYIDLFTNSIAKAPRSGTLQERIRNLNDYHTYAVYKYTSRGLFESHKLLLSLQMTVRVLEASNQINVQEWQFFLSGGEVQDRSKQPPNPAPHWISAETWNNITELETLPHFAGVVQSFDQHLEDWEAWYRATEPESSELPGEWELKCDELQRMIFVRCLRLDRVPIAATTYVANKLGRKYVEPPVLDLKEAYNDSTPFAPLVFVLSPGVDPTSSLRQLAQQKGMQGNFYSLALGQGQAEVATQMINDAIITGSWVFLANCHLMTSWLPELQEIIEGLENREPHQSFRLWLSSNPTPFFPLGILKRSVKMTTEPPKGLKANLARLYSSVTEEEFNECKSRQRYPKLLFALAFFHSVLLERGKFRTLGYNVPYAFNDMDFEVSHDLLKSYLDEYKETPWDALRYLIAEVNYGGRVTDELDRRVLRAYFDAFFCQDAIETPNYALSSLQQYCIPDSTTLHGFREYISELPTKDPPEAFGQHPNAEISYMQEDAKTLLQSCLSLQPKSVGSGTGNESMEDRVMQVTNDLLSQMPEPFDLEQIRLDKADDMSALHVVLLQEVERYNVLLRCICEQCEHLQKGIKGLVVISSELEGTMESLYNNQVPSSWLKAYPSLKALGSWTRDLHARIEQLSKWVNHGYPKVYWLGGFTYPSGLLMAVLQATARKKSVAIDSLGWEFQVINLDESEVTVPPREGIYVKGLYLEGAGWDTDTDSLKEPDAMELVTEMPLLHMKPTENKTASRSKTTVYSCPLYMYPVRTGTTERASYITSVDLKAGVYSPDHWVKRGTALLASLGR